MLHFMYKKNPHVVFCLFSFHSTLHFHFRIALVYVKIDQGIHWVKLKDVGREKRKKEHIFEHKPLFF